MNHQGVTSEELSLLLSSPPTLPKDEPDLGKEQESDYLPRSKRRRKKKPLLSK
ncbi:hypothetical protein [Paenibacillus thalictri]|uniref:hypothetical protein n=1 Tax=Paenibacillus thalictri TaxID=2527873 RepID=UPI0013EEFDC0|nr:hypothetical protein [Paenibacillus thalictri]